MNPKPITKEQLIYDDIEVRPLNEAEVTLLARMVIRYFKLKDGQDKGITVQDELFLRSY